MTKAGPHQIFTVFISSPNDVRPERQHAVSVLADIQRKQRYLGRVALSAVVWDDPAESLPAVLHQSPQLTINDYKRPPAQCDLTILIVWSRLGTLLPEAHFAKADGSPYTSGTEWEVENARIAGRPVFAYFSEQALPRKRSKEDIAQTEALDAWLERTLRNSDGSYAGSVCDYVGLDAFGRKLQEQLEQWLEQQLAAVARLEPQFIARGDVQIPVQLPAPALVGELLGREAERTQLTRRLERGLHTGVVGPAGFGKTALAAASVRDVVGQNGEHLARTPFPDGVVLLDLYRLKAEPGAVFDVLAEAFIGAEHLDLPADRRVRIACGRRRALIIVEGAELADGREDRLALRELWEVSGGCLRLVLTRSLDQIDPSERVDLDRPLQPEAAERLLRLRTGERLADAVLVPVLELLQGHPLALTWAGGLLVRGDADPAALLRCWNAGELLTLREPTQREHTLQWLFQRTVDTISAPARRALVAAGLLAFEPFSGEAMKAVFEVPETAQAALQELVLVSLLRRSRTEANHFELTHVLAHRFARHEPDAPAELRRQLAAWQHATLMHQLSVGANPDFTTLGRTLRHAAALLRTDHDQELWRPLAHDLLILARLTEADPANLDWQRDLSVSLDNVGNVQHEHGDLEGAFASYEASRAIRARLAESHPTNLGWQRDLTVSLDSVGDVQRERGDPQGALASYESSRAIRARLADFDPTNLGWQRDLSVSLDKVGNVQHEYGDLECALASYEASCAIRARLADSNATNLGWQRDLSVSLDNVGNVQRERGDLEGALASYEASRAISARLADSDRTNLGWQRDLSVSLDNVGNVQRERGDSEGALASYEASRVIRARLADADRTNLGWQRDLSVSLTNVGNLQHARGDPEGALASYEASWAISARLADADPTNLGWQRDLSVSLDNVGNVQHSRGDLEGALASYEASRAIRARLADADPTNLGWQRDLSVSLDNVGNVQRARGDLEGTLASYEAAWSIRTRLAEADSTNMVWQRDLSYVLTQLATVHESMGSTAQALELAQASLKIDTQLAVLDPANVTWQKDVRISRAQVERLNAFGTAKTDAV